MKNNLYTAVDVNSDKISLIPLQIEHFEGVFKLFSSPEVTKYSDIKIHKNFDDARNTIASFLDGNSMCWSIFSKPENVFAGIILVLGINQKHKFGSFASAVLPELQSKGIISDAHRLVTAFCFEKTDLNRLESQIFENHIAAEKMLNRSGMKFEGLLRGNFLINNCFENSKIYGITKDDYLKERAFFIKNFMKD